MGFSTLMSVFAFSQSLCIRPYIRWVFLVLAIAAGIALLYEEFLWELGESESSERELIYSGIILLIYFLNYRFTPTAPYNGFSSHPQIYRLYLLLATAAGVAVLYEGFFGASPGRGFLYSLILLLFGYLGSRLESRRGVYFVGRLLLVFFLIIQWSHSVDLLWLGILSVGGVYAYEPLKAYEFLCSGVSLVFVCAASVKYVFGLQGNYWLIFLATCVVVGVSIFYQVTRLFA